MAVKCQIISFIFLVLNFRIATRPTVVTVYIQLYTRYADRLETKQVQASFTGRGNCSHESRSSAIRLTWFNFLTHATRINIVINCQNVLRPSKVIRYTSFTPVRTSHLKVTSSLTIQFNRNCLFISLQLRRKRYPRICLLRKCCVNFCRNAKTWEDVNEGAFADVAPNVRRWRLDGQRPSAAGIGRVFQTAIAKAIGFSDESEVSAFCVACTQRTASERIWNAIDCVHVVITKITIGAVRDEWSGPNG